MTEVKFKIDQVRIGSHNCTDLLKNQHGLGACAVYAVGDVIKNVTGCHVSPLSAYLKINDGKPCKEGCSLEEVMLHAKKIGFFKEESVNEHRIRKQIESDNNPTTQRLNASQVNSSHMDVLYGFKDYRPVFVELEKLDKKSKVERLKKCLKDFQVPIVIGVGGIDFRFLKPEGSDDPSGLRKRKSIPPTPKRKSIIGHAVTVYDWNEDGLRFKNSWGPMADNNLYNNGMATFPYEYTDYIIEAYCAWGMAVWDRDIATGVCTLRPDLGFGHFRVSEQRVKIPQEVTKANVQNLLSELKYIKKSVQLITLSKIADADRESVKNTLILAFDNEDEWPAVQYASELNCSKKKIVFYDRRLVKKQKQQSKS